MKKHLPNIITLLNSLSGVIAVLFAATDHLIEAAFFVLLGIFFDFFDGLAARLLKAQSDLGLELDSLADVVTSGVAPGIVMFQLLSRTLGDWGEQSLFQSMKELDLLPYVGLLLPLAAAYRLAKFNLDTRQTDAFIGLPTPAMALYVISLPLIIAYGGQDLAVGLISDKYFLLISTIALAILMNLELPLFSLKFKDFSFNKYLTEIIFLVIALLLVLTVKFVAIPIIIILYVLISLFKRNN
ncbi:MAG: CDP-alcohol phosphatidyltransferase family protein [Flavobacteriaceae bacterium]|nr:CDP-alcohol phosphatidyltransferase family protein [Flavobacteriaceae bacterium]